MSGRIGGPSRPRATPLPLKPDTIRTRARMAQSRASSSMKVFVHGLKVSASIGVHPHEHETQQTIIVDVELDLGLTPAPKDDRLSETIDYQSTAQMVGRVCAEGHVQLVETLADRIVTELLNDDRVCSVTVRIAKPDALDAAAAAGCEIQRTR